MGDNDNDDAARFRELFRQHVRWVDAAYYAFSAVETADEARKPIMMRVAYEAKERRTSALIELMEFLKTMDIWTLAEGLDRYYRERTAV